MTTRILCLIVLLLEIRGLSLSLPGRKWMALVFYTQLSNLVTAVSALLLLLFGQPYAVTVLRYLSTCMLVMTFFVTTCVLTCKLLSASTRFPTFRDSVHITRPYHAYSDCSMISTQGGDYLNNPNTSNSDLAKAVQIAQFRFALIVPVIQGLFPDASRSHYCLRGKTIFDMIILLMHRINRFVPSKQTMPDPKELSTNKVFR